MMVGARSTILLVAAGLAVVAGCKSRDQACSVDADCTSGLACTDGACVAGNDADVPDGAVPVTTPAPDIDAAAAPRCAALYELCATVQDCCEGLTCRSGACR